MRVAAVLLLIVAVPAVAIVRACTRPYSGPALRRYRGNYPYHNGPFA